MFELYGEPQLRELLEIVRLGVKAQKGSDDQAREKSIEVCDVWHEQIKATQHLSGKVHSLNEQIQEKNALLSKYRALESVLMAKDPKGYPNRICQVLEARTYEAADHPMAIPNGERSPPTVIHVSLADRREQLETAKSLLEGMDPDAEGYEDAKSRVTLLEHMIRGREKRGEG